MNRALRWKCIGYAIITLVFFVLQTSAQSICRVFGFTPNFMLLLTLAVAFRESETFAAFYGLCCGLLYDLTTQSSIGLRAVLFMFGAYLLAIALQTIFRPYFLTYVYVTLAVLAASVLFDYLFYLLLGGAISFGGAFRRMMVPQFLLSGVWSYGVYYVVYRFNLFLQRRNIL